MALNNTQKRRLIIASIFAIFSILRLNRDLNKWIAVAGDSIEASIIIASSFSITAQTLPIATAAYAVSITSCGPKLSARLYDAAAVLRKSIELNSYPLNKESRYGAKFYSFTLKQPDGSDPAVVDRCYQLLQKAGWDPLPQDPPIYPSLIKEPEGAVLKMGIRSDGCCGDRELIKLSTYKLIDHEFAVHLDLDTLVLHPMDELFDAMYFGPQTEEGRRARIQLAEVAAPTYINRRNTGNPAKSGKRNATDVLANITVDAFFTKDYNMIVPGKHEQKVGVQGGFLAVRPSMDTYTHLLSLVYSGEFYGGTTAQKGMGWLKSGYGRHIWGSMTIQGLMAYYFDVEQLEHSVELNRCRYNNIADNARVSGFAKNPKFPRCTLLPFIRDASNPRYNFNDKQCRDGRPKCDDTDCQRFPLKKTRVVHYTYCKNPWKCNDCTYLETYKEPLCYEFLREWFRVRSTLPGEGNRTLDGVSPEHDKKLISVIKEDGEVETKQGNCFKEFYLGYCTEPGKYVGLQHKEL